MPASFALLAIVAAIAGCMESTPGEAEDGGEAMPPIGERTQAGNMTMTDCNVFFISYLVDPADFEEEIPEGYEINTQQYEVMAPLVAEYHRCEDVAWRNGSVADAEIWMTGIAIVPQNHSLDNPDSTFSDVYLLEMHAEPKALVSALSSIGFPALLSDIAFQDAVAHEFSITHDGVAWAEIRGILPQDPDEDPQAESSRFHYLAENPMWLTVYRDPLAGFVIGDAVVMATQGAFAHDAPAHDAILQDGPFPGGRLEYWEAAA